MESGMHVEIDQAYEGVVAAAVAAGKAHEAQAFVNDLIGRYNREPKTQAETEAILLAAEQRGFVRFESTQTAKDDTLSTLKKRLRDRGV